MDVRGALPTGELVVLAVTGVRRRRAVIVVTMLCCSRGGSQTRAAEHDTLRPDQHEECGEDSQCFDAMQH